MDDAKREYHLEVFADYYQFHIQEPGAAGESMTDWTAADVAVMAKVDFSVVALCPVRNMTVPVHLEIRDTEPVYDLEGVDHAIRCSLDLPSGELQVSEAWGTEYLRLRLPGGTYGLLALYCGLGTLSEDGLDGDDSYRVILWPSSPCPLTVLKQWTES